MVMEMNLLSLNSDGAFRTMMQRRMPHSRNRNSTVGEKGKADLLRIRTGDTTTVQRRQIRTVRGCEKFLPAVA